MIRTQKVFRPEGNHLGFENNNARRVASTFLGRVVIRYRGAKRDVTLTMTCFVTFRDRSGIK